MPDTVTFEVKGLSELEAKLEALPKKLADRGVRAALRAGSNVVYRAMLSLCPRVEKFIPGIPPGFLAEHIGSKIKLLRGYVGGYAYIGPKGKVDYPMSTAEIGPAFYRTKTNRKGRTRSVGRVAVASVARFLEFGTSKMGKHPFMTQAAEGSKSATVEAMVNSLRATLEE